MVLEVAIGLIFVYLLFSLICSALSEIVAWMLSLRARTLRSGVETLLKDKAFADLARQNPRLRGLFEKDLSRVKQAEQSVAGTLYAHPLVQAMMQDGKHPSYIPKQTFSAAFMDVLRGATRQDAATPGDAMQKLRAALASLPEDSEIRQQLDAMLDETVTTVQEAHARVERWFDDSMNRVSGWYKRRTHFIIFVVATLVVCAANGDSVMIAQSLAHDSVLRQAMVAAAEQTVKSPLPEERSEPDAAKAVAQLQLAQAQLTALRLPIGWTGDLVAQPGQLPDPRRRPEGWDWLAKMAGLVFTIIAVSMGAPFWFDLLNRVVNARLAGEKPEEGKPKRAKKKDKKKQE